MNCGIWERDGPQRRWTMPWARWLPATVHHAMSVPAQVHSVALSMLEGRPVIICCGGDATVRVWDLATCKPQGKPLRGHKGSVHSVAVGMLERRPVIVSGGADATVRVWDLATCKLQGKPLRGHKGPVHSVAVGTLKRGPVIVSGGRDE